MFLNNKKEYYIIIGNNKENGLILNSIKNDKEKVPIVLFDQDESNNHILNIKKVIKTNSVSFVTFLKKTFKNLKKYHINVIINLFDNTKSIDYVNEIKILVNELDLDTKTFNVYAFIDVKDYHILDEINANSNGTINIFNIDKEVAIGFVNKYPITKYMSESHIDKENACINKDVNMNVCLLGFGGINQQIFKAYVSSNVFTGKENNKITNRLVNYYLYDKDNLENNQYLNQYYYHYQKEFLVNVRKNDYLPLPNIPANVYLNNCNVYSLEFLKKLRNNLTSSNVNYNYIIISLSDDLTNISLGNTIINKLIEWNLLDYTKVFVYVKENSLYRYMPKDLHYFGNNLDIFNINNICHNFFKYVSIKRNFIYQIEQLLNNDKKVNEYNTINEKIEYLKTKEDEIYSNINKEFGNSLLISKESNVYSLLSIRCKLNLLGFDYELQDSSNISEASDYYKAYEKNNLIEYVKDLIYKGKGVINYPIFCNKKFEINPRNVLAYNEHSRWNAYMIASGVTPSSINDILISTNELGENTNGKDLRNYKHGHLAHYDGLSKFIYLLVNRDLNNKNKGSKYINKDTLLKKYDIFKYDYQLMDDLEYFLSDDNSLYNYVIVSKKYLDCSKFNRLNNIKKEHNNENKNNKNNENNQVNKKEIKQEENNKEKKIEDKKEQKEVNKKFEEKKVIEEKKEIKEEDKKEENKKVEKQTNNKKVEEKKEVKQVEKKEVTQVQKEKKENNNQLVIEDKGKKIDASHKKPYIPYWKKRNNKKKGNNK